MLSYQPSCSLAYSMFVVAGSLLSAPQAWGQQYVQKVQDRMGWFTGGALNFHFAISQAYGE